MKNGTNSTSAGAIWNKVMHYASLRLPFEPLKISLSNFCRFQEITLSIMSLRISTEIDYLYFKDYTLYLSLKFIRRGEEIEIPLFPRTALVPQGLGQLKYVLELCFSERQNHNWLPYYNRWPVRHPLKPIEHQIQPDRCLRDKKLHIFSHKTKTDIPLTILITAKRM